MSVFLLKDPDAVFIHIPKTAGRSVRVGAWQGRYEGPIRGPMPDEWRGQFKFAFVRHPLDRLVSAWRMFAQGRDQVPEIRPSRLHALIGVKKDVVRMRAHRPLFPGLSLPEFFALASDESVGFDESARATNKRLAVLRRHAIPQSHPYNLVHEADFVGRFESLQSDIETLSATLRYDLVLPHTNKARGISNWQAHFTPDLLAKAVDYYKDDFDQFGYTVPDMRSIQD